MLLNIIVVGELSRWISKPKRALFQVPFTLETVSGTVFTAGFKEENIAEQLK